MTPASSKPAVGLGPVVPYAAFAAFGVFWGTWGAALPAIRSQAGVSEGELGTALLFVGTGALPAMLLTGRLLDRVGSRLAAPLLATLGVAGFLLASGARSLTLLIAGMLLVGATSGAADVAINTVTGHIEHDSGRPLLTRAHGVFSLAVVVASLVAGTAQSGGSTHEGASRGALQLTFALAAGAMLALTVLVWVGTCFSPPRPASPITTTGYDTESSTPSHNSLTSKPCPRVTAVPLLVVGLVGALAYAAENAHQSWGAVFLTDSFTASTQTASLAPATFAAAAAVIRLTLAPLSRTHPVPLLVIGGAVAAVGSLLLAVSTSAPVALLGLAIAAAGTATLFPTLLSSNLRHVGAERRGRATSVIATTAYLGFLLGPAYVGLLADHVGLRGAIIGVAALAVTFSITSAPASRWTRAKFSSPRDRSRSRIQQ